MEHGHDDLGGGHPLFLVDADRNPATIILDAHRVVRVDNHIDFVAMPCEGFVDGIVHHLENHMVQTGAVISVADVHTRALADGVQALEDLDGGCVVTV